MPHFADYVIGEKGGLQPPPASVQLEGTKVYRLRQSLAEPLSVHTDNLSVCPVWSPTYLGFSRRQVNCVVGIIKSGLIPSIEHFLVMVVKGPVTWLESSLWAPANHDS